MKRQLVSAILFAALACAAKATDTTPGPVSQNLNVAAPFSATSASRVPLIKATTPPETPQFSELSADLSSAPSSTFDTALALPMESAPAAESKPSPKPSPRFIFSDRDDYRWQVSVGLSFERFRSSIYSASGVGTASSISYYLNDWLAGEFNVNTFFAGTVFNGERVKLVNYGGGPKISWRQPRWEPWMHALFGGTHALPQVAGHSQNGLSMQFGGGADYRLLPRLSFRLELDYVRTRLFGDWQNNGQAAAGVVFHF
jgi:hypothetical protein